jgi:hypothetical protein
MTMQRPAESGELCTCGRKATVVFQTEAHGEVGWCGLADRRAARTLHVLRRPRRPPRWRCVPELLARSASTRWPGDRPVMNGRPHTTTDFGLAVVAGFAAFTFLLWLGGESAVVVSGHDMIHGRFLAGVIAVAHIGHPASAWGSPVGPVWTYWLCTLLVVAIGAALTLLSFTVLRHLATGRPSTSPGRGEGFAPRAEIERSAGSRALLRRSRTLRPSLPHPRPADVGYFLGTSRRVPCWASVEDSMLLLGPPRSGKGQNIVIPAILDAPGAVVTTSTRPDNLAVTLSRSGI